MVVRLPVLLQQFGLAMWTLGGTIAQNAAFVLYTVFQNAAEATAGKIPVYQLRPSRQIQIASRNNEIHTAPVLEHTGWLDRDEDQFGPRTVPPPLPLVGSAAPATMLPPANSNEPNEPAPSLAIPPWEEPPPTSPVNDNDPFQGMIPLPESPPRPQRSPF